MTQRVVTFIVIRTRIRTRADRELEESLKREREWISVSLEQRTLLHIITL